MVPQLTRGLAYFRLFKPIEHRGDIPRYFVRQPDCKSHASLDGNAKLFQAALVDHLLHASDTNMPDTILATNGHGELGRFMLPHPFVNVRSHRSDIV